MKTEMKHIDTAIERGISFLAEHQFHHGEFCTYMGAGEALTEWCIPDSSNFSTAVICTFLLPLKDHPSVDVMFKKASSFLRYQMMRGGVWNYFTVWHKLFPICPADADDTACISAFLKEMQHPFPDNTPMLLANRNKKGLYYTWFTLRFNRSRNITYWKLLLRELKHPFKNIYFWYKNEGSKNDIDAVVNANVLYYLGLNEDTAPIVPFLLKIIDNHEETNCDKWYRNPFVVYYAIARNYQKGIAALADAIYPITERILSAVRTNGSIGNSSADTAMAIVTLLNFNHSTIVLENAVAYLLNMQATNGSWERCALSWIGPKQKIGFGSEELTTSLCLEALARYRQLKAQERSIEKALHEVS
jgi:hypothetical protein